MSKEAKIGLLLGLVFIIAIAVVLKRVHNNSNSEPGNMLGLNGTTEGHTDPGSGNGNGIEMPKLVGQFDLKPEPQTPEETNIDIPANDTNGSVGDNGDLNNNQVHLLNPPTATTRPPWAGDPPRLIAGLPGSVSTNPPAQSSNNVIARIGDDPEPGEGQWIYVVKKDDKLWTIAQKELGNGARMHEIIRLNSLASPDNLKIDQKLQMPSRQNRASTSPGTIQPSRSASSSGSGEYVVRKGDNLGSIASNELGSYARWPEIQRLNNLPNDIVLEGQIIRLPDRQSSTTISSSNTISSGDRLYVVKDGETLWVIAQRELGDPTRWTEIRQLNNLPSENVQKEQKIRLPIR